MSMYWSVIIIFKREVTYVSFSHFLLRRFRNETVVDTSPLIGFQKSCLLSSGKEPQVVGNTHETLSEIQFPSMTVIGDSVTYLSLRFLTNKHVIVELQVLLLSAVAMLCGHYLLLTVA